MNLNVLKEIDSIELKENIDLSKYSTIKLKTIGNLLIINSVDAVSKVLMSLKKNDIRYQIVGLGANQVLTGNPDLLYVKLMLPFDKSLLDQEANLYILPASVPLSLLTLHAKKFCLKDWDFLTGIPATLGGAVTMNAGISSGEISSIVHTVKIVDVNGNSRNEMISEESFSYRNNHFLNPGEIIVEVTLKNNGKDPDVPAKIDHHLKHRDQTQPWKEKTCGCVFKNYSKTCRAGHFIDIIGLKGFTLNGVKVSHLHGNFFVNYDGADYETFRKVVNIVQDELYLQFGKNFETEVLIR